MEPDQKKPSNPLLKYSGMGAQMGVIIGLSVWGGMQLDKHYGGEDSSLYTIICSMTGVIASMYIIIKSVINDSK